MSRVGLAYSINDPAGSGIARSLYEKLGLECRGTNDPRAKIICENKEHESLGVDGLIGFVEDVVYLEYLDHYFPNSDAVIVLSRHSSEAAIPSLTVHYPGNPRREATFGGRPMELSFTKPSLSTALLRNIHDLADREGLSRSFEISYEATHHGPTSNRKPVIFVEIGSTEREWLRNDLHILWAEAVLETLRGRNIICERVVVGFGGPHYSKRFTELSIENRYCFGHIIPKYAARELRDEELIEILLEAVSKSIEKIDLVLIEKKTVTSDKIRALESKCKELGIEALRI